MKLECYDDLVDLCFLGSADEWLAVVQVVKEARGSALIQEALSPPVILYVEQVGQVSTVHKVVLSDVHLTEALPRTATGNYLIAPEGFVKDTLVPLRNQVLNKPMRLVELMSSELGLSLVMVGVMVGLPALAALAGDTQYALSLARLTSVVLGPVGLVRQLADTRAN